MDPGDFASGQRQRLVRADGGYLAFLPAPLPPVVDLTPRLVAKISAAERALGRLAGVGLSLPNPHLLSSAMVRREAVLSSRIEGTQATLSDLVLFEVEPTAPGLTGDVREVANYVRAVEHVLDPDRRLPLSISLLREAHSILMEGVRGGHAAPGEVRRTQNWIGPPGCVIDNATFVPPSPEHLWECLDAFEKHLHFDCDLPPLMRLAAIHYQFEAIHPFLDGNGRLGRLLVTEMLVEWAFLPGPLLDLSAYIEPRRDVYYERLLNVSTQGDWAAWFEFFIDAIAAQAMDAGARAARLQRLRDHYRATVAMPRASALLPTLVEALFQIPAMTFTRAEEVMGVTHRAATQNVDRLVEAGILVEVPRRGRQRFFLATGILDAIEGRAGLVDGA